MKFSMGVCGYCYPGANLRQKKELVKVVVMRLPNGVDACDDCYKKVVDKKPEGA